MRQDVLHAECTYVRIKACCSCKPKQYMCNTTFTESVLMSIVTFSSWLEGPTVLSLCFASCPKCPSAIQFQHDFLSRSSSICWEDRFDAFLRVPDDVVSTKTCLNLLQVLEQMKAALCLGVRWWRSFDWLREENSPMVICCQHLRLSTMTIWRLFRDTLFQQLQCILHNAGKHKLVCNHNTVLYRKIKI